MSRSAGGKGMYWQEVATQGSNTSCKILVQFENACMIMSSLTSGERTYRLVKFEDL